MTLYQRDSNSYYYEYKTKESDLDTQLEDVDKQIAALK